ncbi:MAG: hypothetical protein Q4F81_12540 [Eubacteriales bacterium]|nr:hypothetical protein [Eubacteriales bacterium]
MLWVWEKFDSIDWKALACILLTALGMYLLTDSRTAFLCEILLCLLVALAKYGRKAAVLLHYAAKWAAPAGAVFTLITTILWITTPDLPFLKQLNRLLSGRVYLSAHAFSHYGITLFGQPLAMDPVTVTPEWPTPFIALDNVYAYFFCCMGTIWLILICLSFYRLGKLRDSRISISLILWAVYGISEMLTIRVYYFFPLLLICIVFQPKEELARRYPAMEGQRLSRSPILPD